MLKRLFANFATPGMVLGLAASMLGLYAIDQFLANLERRELGAQARHEYDAGQKFLRAGDAKAAITSFLGAHTLERDNRYYQLGLADAYIADGHPERAVATLEDVLAQDSNDGPANLLMARAMIAQQRNPAADSFYHRAIYGSWPPDQSDRRVQARLELVRWLAKRGERNELLAELLPLEQTTSLDPAIDREIPALYLQAGSLRRAEEAYRALMHAQPEDPQAYAGLGRVALQKGEFGAAERAFAGALQREPGNAAADRASAQQALQLARRAAELDPTPRRLTSSEKLMRSNQLLTLAADRAEACFAKGDAAPPSPAIQQARQMVTEKVKAATNEMAENRLDLAEQIWKSAPANCEAMREEGELLAAVMPKLGSMNGNADQ